MYGPLFFGGQRHSSSEISCPATPANLGLKCTCSKPVFAIYRGAGKNTVDGLLKW